MSNASPSITTVRISEIDLEMVRIKNRYLLINILYPSESPKESRSHSTNLPNLVIFHQPSPKGFNSDALRNSIRASVRDLFGDYGVGALGASLRGMSPSILLVSPISTHLANALPSFFFINKCFNFKLCQLV